MGRARTLGFSFKLMTAEAEHRANRLVGKDAGRFEIEQKVDGPYFSYLPRGAHGSMEQYHNGLNISKWVEKNEGNEPD